MKKVFKSLISFIIILSVLLSMSVTSAFGDDELSLTGTSAIVYCATTGEVVYELNADEQMNPASITKLMTCLLAIENLDLDQEVEITSEPTTVIPTKIYLQEGEIITVRDLLYASLLYSANDAASALAIAVAGSIEAFADMMNERAEALGCTNTHFENPHGLAGEEHYVSARDVALIAAEAFSNETLREIAGTTEYTIEATNLYPERTVKTTNLFLTGGTIYSSSGEVIEVSQYEGVFGGKTGTSESAVATMVVGMTYDEVELYAVILGTTTQSRYIDMKKLLDYGQENVSTYIVFDEGEEYGEGKLLGGAVNRVSGIAGSMGYIYLPAGASDTLITIKAVYYEDLIAPIEEGQTIGVIEIYLANEKLKEVDLVAGESVEEGWFLSGYGVTNKQTLIICSIVGAILFFILLILLLRFINRKRVRHRRHRQAVELARRELEKERRLRQRD